jgi:hypothetical protein
LRAGDNLAYHAISQKVTTFIHYPADTNNVEKRYVKSVFLDGNLPVWMMLRAQEQDIS